MKYEYIQNLQGDGLYIFLSSNLEKMCKNEMCMTMDNIDYDMMGVMIKIKKAGYMYIRYVMYI